MIVCKRFVNFRCFAGVKFIILYTKYTKFHQLNYQFFILHKRMLSYNFCNYGYWFAARRS